MSKFAVFDIDGTLLRWQLYHALFNDLAKKGKLGPGIYEELKDKRLAWKKRSNPDAFKQYERYMVNVYDRELPSLSTQDIELAAQDVLEEHKLQVYTFTRDLIGSLKSQGYMILAISGSHHEMVEGIAKHYGFDDWIGSSYEVKDGKFTGNKLVVSDDKAVHLKQLMDKHQLDFEGSVGVGDTSSDIAFLDKVETPIAFNPDQKLYDLARSKRWQIVIERKNVVYSLSPAGDDYKLN